MLARVVFSNQLSQLLCLQLLSEVAQGLAQGLLPHGVAGAEVMGTNIWLKLDFFMKYPVINIQWLMGFMEFKIH